MQRCSGRNTIRRSKKENGKYQLDLWEANRIILTEAGVPEIGISVTDICTHCNPELLFSHRTSADRRGNLCAFLCLKENDKSQGCF